MENWSKDRENSLAPHHILSPHFNFSYHMLNWLFKSRLLTEMKNTVQCFSVFTVPRNHIKDLLKQIAGPQLERLWFSWSAIGVENLPFSCLSKQCWCCLSGDHTLRITNTAQTSETLVSLRFRSISYLFREIPLNPWFLCPCFYKLG